MTHLGGESTPPTPMSMWKGGSMSRADWVVYPPFSFFESSSNSGCSSKCISLMTHDNHELFIMIQDIHEGQVIHCMQAPLGPYPPLTHSPPLP